MDVQAFIDKRFSYVVIGATVNKDKYGYRVLKDLSSAGYHVVGVNPKYRIVDSMPVFHTLADVPGKVDVAIFVVPPDIGLHLLPQVEEKGVKKIWMQPGAESKDLIAAAHEAGIETNEPGSCIMVARRSMA